MINRVWLTLWLSMLIDGALAAVAAPLAYWIAVPNLGLYHPLWFVAGGGISLAIAGLPFRLQQQRWRYVGVNDLLNVIASAAAAVLLFWALRSATGFSAPTPTFPIIHLLVLTSLLALPRVAMRLRRRGNPQTEGAMGLLLAGAGEQADLFLRMIEHGQERRYRVAGMLATAVEDKGRRLHGHAVLGLLGDLPAVMQRLRERGQAPAVLVLCDAAIRGAALSTLLEQADMLGLQLRRAPHPGILLDVRNPVSLREIAVEELLGRAPVQLDRGPLSAMTKGKCVMVTGAGGTIGSELVRQLSSFCPARLVLLDHSEFALWQIETEIAATRPHVNRRIVVADVRDAQRINRIFAEERPELVFHAAALKHVPMVEANRLEGLRTNVLGTQNLADACRVAGSCEMVLISTDKAVNPNNVMGASKRLAEIYCQAQDVQSAVHGGPRYSIVRFGNVLGSTGSVVPLFSSQIARGGPVTVTHPEMERYFMTVPEAVGLVLQASALEVGDSSAVPRGSVFVLDMGPPVRILELARQMIRLAGLRPGHDIEIRFTGARAGERLHEELAYAGENLRPTRQAGVLVGTPRVPDAGMVEDFTERLAGALHSGDEAAAIKIMEAALFKFNDVPALLSVAAAD